jgi:hypothetical protein
MSSRCAKNSINKYERLVRLAQQTPSQRAFAGDAVLPIWAIFVFCNNDAVDIDVTPFPRSSLVKRIKMFGRFRKSSQSNFLSDCVTDWMEKVEDTGNDLSSKCECDWSEAQKCWKKMSQMSLRIISSI